jgi:hypothetical protein
MLGKQEQQEQLTQVVEVDQVVIQGQQDLMLQAEPAVQESLS